MSVGERSELRAQIVSDAWLTKLGEEIGIEKLIIKGPKALGDKNSKNTIICEATEALIGAIYLDQGFDYVENFILRIWKKNIDKSTVTILDSKTKLQEYSLKKFKSLPIYKLVSSSGPRHKPKFTISVRLKDTKLYEGSGDSKKKAEQNAAKKLLGYIK